MLAVVNSGSLRCLSAAAVLAVLLAIWVRPAAAATVIFTDLSQSSWATHDILSLARDGILRGYPDGTVRPNAPVSRAEWTALVYRAVYGHRAPAPSAAPFADVPADNWAAPVIAAARDRGWILFPTPGGDFGPADAIDREEAASMLAAAFLGVTPGDPEGSAASIPAVDQDTCRQPAACLVHFADAGSVAAWARPGVAEAVAAGLLRGYPDGGLRPTGQLTRAAAAALIYRVVAQMFVYGSRRFRAVETLHLRATSYGSDEPGIGTTTATGTVARPGEVAVDPSYLPLGTYLWITGYQSPYLPRIGILEHAEDTGGDVRGPEVDIFMDGPPGAYRTFGIQGVTATVLVPLT
jgi:3D (Asp-Asp-Asp) domain-containing protein